MSGVNLGGAYGGADFKPYRASETEIQRFCQSYMTELSKYIGPDVDLPGREYIYIYMYTTVSLIWLLLGMGDGVTSVETGYLYGQYKRINEHYGQMGQGLLWGGNPEYTKVS